MRWCRCAFVDELKRQKTAEPQGGIDADSRRHKAGLCVLLFAFCFLPPAYCVSQTGKARRGGPQAVEFRNIAPSVAYVGSDVCAGCHADLYADYRKTGMGRSMSLAAEPDQLAKVPVPVTLEVGKFKRYFQVYRAGSSLYQSEYELDAGGKEVFRNTQKLEYVIGSGSNGFTYVVRRGGYLFEAPLSYYSKTRTWELSPGYEFEDYGFSRPIAAGCIACHSGLARHVPERDGLYEEPPFRELSIGCESCHGPGQLHVRERLDGAPVSGAVDRAVVNPAKLPAWLADNICMNCHQGGDTRVLQPGKEVLDFRPGTPLNNTVAIFAVPFSRQAPPDSPLLQHYALMTLSRCYRSSRGSLSCITCHSPHRRASSEEAPSYYRSKCLVCHSQQSCKLPLMVRVAKTPPDDCAGCHLPKQDLGIISHSALTNHRIIARQGEPYPDAAFHQTTPDLPDLIHLNAIPGQERSSIPRLTLLKAYSDLSITHPAYQERVRALLNEFSQAEPDDPFVLAALARDRARLGTPEAISAATRELARAIELGSTSSADFEGLADLLAGSGHAAKAIPVLKRGIELNPYSRRLYKALALVDISVHRYADALETMKKELELFPEDSFMRMLVVKAEAAGQAQGQK